MKNITDKAFHGLKWNYIGVFIRGLVQVVVGVVLARILGPKPFGQLAAVLIFIGLGNLFADFGFGAALIHASKLTDNDIRSAFTIQLIFGCILSIVMFFAAPFFAFFLKQEEIVIIIKVMSLLFIFQALGQTSRSLIRRDLEFKKLQIAQIAAYFISYVFIGIPLALLGYDVWSIVIAYMCQSLFFSAFSILQKPHPMRLMLKPDHHNLISYGSKIVLANTSSWALVEINNLFLSRSFGPIGLGLYNRIYFFLYNLTYNVTSSLQQVLFSVNSKIKDEKEKLKKAYIASLNVVALIFIPVFLVVAMISETVIVGLFGYKWIKSVPLITPISIALVFHALLTLAGPLIEGCGKTGKEISVQTRLIIVQIAALFICSHYTLELMAWVIAIIFFMRFLMLNRVVSEILNLSRTDFYLSLKGSILISIVIGFFVKTTDTLLILINLAPFNRLFLDLFIGFCLFLTLVYKFRHYVIISEIFGLVLTNKHKLPAFLTRYFN